MTLASCSQPLSAVLLGSGPSSQNRHYSQQTEVISCWQIGCIQKMSSEQVQWLELCSLPCLEVSVIVFGFTVQDPASIHHLFISSSVPRQLSFLLLCLLLLLDPPHELWFSGSSWSSAMLLSKCMQASWCQTLRPTICLPYSVRLMSIICLWFLISDCLNYITWLLPPPRLKPQGFNVSLVTPMSRHNSLHRQV